MRILLFVLFFPFAAQATTYHYQFLPESTAHLNIYDQDNSPRVFTDGDWHLSVTNLHYFLSATFDDFSFNIDGPIENAGGPANFFDFDTGEFSTEQWSNAEMVLDGTPIPTYLTFTLSVTSAPVPLSVNAQIIGWDGTYQYELFPNGRISGVTVTSNPEPGAILLLLLSLPFVRFINHSSESSA